MRVFIAIPLPEDTKDYLITLQKNFHGLGDISFVSKDKFHLTLRFFADISEKEVEIMRKQLTNLKFSAFSVSFNHLGAFPNQKNVRVLWAGIEEKQILQLKKEIDKILGLKEESFSQHLTLGRVKSLENKEEFIKRLQDKIQGKFFVDSFQIIQSIPSAQGYSHKILETYHLS